MSFVAPNESFFDQLDAFSIARLLKNTLVPLFFGETHYLLSLRASLSRELTQRGFSFAKIGQILMQKSDPLGQRADAGLRPTWEQQNIWMEPGQLVAQK